LGLGVLQDYNKLRADTQSKNISAWTPVIAEILEGFSRFDDKAVSHPKTMLFINNTLTSSLQFTRYLSAVYPLAIDLLTRDVAPEVRKGLKDYLTRVGFAQGIVDSSS
jgi:brefeldin A-inhibited guanine nucleotide-exchange protein